MLDSGASAVKNIPDEMLGSRMYCFELVLKVPSLEWPLLLWVGSRWLAKFLTGKPASIEPYLFSA